jgi:hypothetical protein
MKSISGIKDVDVEILLNLDNKDLINVCLTNSHFREICESNAFWRRRVMKEAKISNDNLNFLIEYLNFEPTLKGVQELYNFLILDDAPITKTKLLLNSKEIDDTVKDKLNNFIETPGFIKEHGSKNNFLYYTRRNYFNLDIKIFIGAKNKAAKLFDKESTKEQKKRSEDRGENSDESDE